MMISYAQDGEDVLLRRVFPHDHAGFYVDIGANDPVVDSVTKHFSDLGWRGINIEPIPALHERLGRDRPRDINLNLGVADQAGSLTFFEAPSRPGWSTFSSDLACSYRDRGLTLREYPVPVRTLAAICAEHRGDSGTIDFLKVDAEGFEREILLGHDWTRWRPRVVVIEDAWPDRWEPILLGAGYVLAHRSRLNRFYGQADDEATIDALRPPLGATDGFVRHQHAQLLVSLNHRFDAGEDLSPAALGLALWLRRQSQRHPRLLAAGKRLLRPAIRRRADG